MKRFINFGSIPQFRQTIKDIQHATYYTGQDANSEPIFDKTLPLPTLLAVGTEKIHGTNAAVCFSNSDGFWVQSRNNIITPVQDNAGCAFAAYARENNWQAIINQLASDHKINLDTHIISIYFEWAGGNIQRNSALSGTDKSAIIFAYFKSSPILPQLDSRDAEVSIWLPTGKVSNPEARIFNINNYPAVIVPINFEQPALSQNKMIEAVNTIETSSPVGQTFGFDSNIGEGYVFSFLYKNNLYRFKVKGEKHSASKVKTLTPVDEELENTKINFVNNHACTPARLEQAWQNTFGIEDEISEPTIALIGTFLRHVMSDVAKEESDIMLSLGLEPKQVNSLIAKSAKTWFFSELDAPKD